MKHNKVVIPLILALVVISSINCKKKGNKEIWLQRTELCERPFSDGINLLEFEGDSIFIRTFLNQHMFSFNNWDKDLTTNITDYPLFQIVQTGTYHLGSKALNISVNKQLDTFSIDEKSNSQMKLSGDYKYCYHNGDKGYEVTFLKLPRYNQAKNANRLNKLLKNNLFQLQTSIDSNDTLYLDFFENNHYQLPEVNKLYDDRYQFWYINKYEGELFLIFDLALLYPIHIKSITDQKIIGIVHQEEETLLEFKKIPTEHKFKKEYLIGKWEEQNPPEGPPAPKKEKNIPFYDREYLEISQEYIIKNRWHNSDTLEYMTGNFDEFIIIPRMWTNIDRRRWKIISLSKQELELQIKAPMRPEHLPIKFKKIE
jgi:hypothetical protein